MKKRIIALTMALFCLTGCAKVTNEYSTIEDGVITSKNYRAAYMTPMRVGKVTTFMRHPARYNVTICMDGYEVNWNDKEIYEAYEIGDDVKVIVNYKEYDDGTIRKHATGLAPEE